MKTALHWARMEDGAVRCGLCPHHCAPAEGTDGLCRVRGVRGGELRALGYGRVSSAHVDPIEKKPLYHYMPGTPIFSIGGWGCNFRCEFCQNWSISQQGPGDGETWTPEDVVNRAERAGAPAIAYTYNEPLVEFEFVLDCARLARQRGLGNVLVTNGYVEPAPAAELLPFVDALNVDVKTMRDEMYRRHCGGRLAPVLAFCQQSAAAGCHLELTNLVVPGMNDADDDFRALAGWVRTALGARTVLHLSAYYPQYRSEAPPTPTPTLLRAYGLCREELAYVYLGNVRSGERGRNTQCPACGAVLVERNGYETRIRELKGGRCAACGAAADIVTVPVRTTNAPG